MAPLRRGSVSACLGFIRNFQNENAMPFVEAKKFRYPAEEECLVRRLGSAVIVSWVLLPREMQEKILSEAKAAWDREYNVPRLPERLNTLLRRFAE
jgi:hypothetical protein